MESWWRVQRPRLVDSAIQEAKKIGFEMSSDDDTGQLLQLFAASKPGGSVLEVGTGVGVGAAWLSSGMDRHSKLISIETNEELYQSATNRFRHDPRIDIINSDALEYLVTCPEECFDLTFIDFRPGKFIRLDLALRSLKPGGIYVADDLKPQSTWPDDHSSRIASFCQEVGKVEGFSKRYIDDKSGTLIMVKCTK